jgi:fatty-acyl-CoA synthase
VLEANWLGRLARYHPERRAVWFRDDWLTYAELYRRARKAAKKGRKIIRARNGPWNR